MIVAGMRCTSNWGITAPQFRTNSAVTALSRQCQFAAGHCGRSAAGVTAASYG
jgi:hypothetical protein